MRTITARHIGFCSGVKRALAAVEDIMKSRHGRKIVLLHEIVHNTTVVNDLMKRGVMTVQTPDEAPKGSVLVISAHGVPEKVEKRARELGLEVVDATCPLVRKVHTTAGKFVSEGYRIILAGKRDHREVEGILGRVPENTVDVIESAAEAELFTPVQGQKYALLAQTTFNSSELEKIDCVLKEKLGDFLVSPGNVCNATAARQKAVEALAKQCSVVFVAGSSGSSNSRRLVEIAEAAGTKAFLVENAAAVLPEMYKGALVAGIAAGASAPATVIDGLRDFLESLPED